MNGLKKGSFLLALIAATAADCHLSISTLLTPFAPSVIVNLNTQSSSAPKTKAVPEGSFMNDFPSWVKRSIPENDLFWLAII